MAFFSSMRPAAALMDLLEREHKALLTGQFQSLERISAPKEALMKSIAKSRPNQHELNALKVRSARNRRLLEASARGLKSARLRLAQLQQKPASLKTYGPSGGITALGDKSLTMKKKA